MLKRTIEKPEFPDVAEVVFQSWEPIRLTARPNNTAETELRHYMFSIHATREDRDAYVEEYENRPGASRKPCGRPYLVGIGSELFDELNVVENGIYRDPWSL